MSRKYVIALDQGTTSSRAVLVDHEGRVVDGAQRPFEQLYPRPGWVEHRPQDILSSQLGVLTELLVRRGLGPDDIECIGITNQRETTLVWDRATGEPLFNAKRLVERGGARKAVRRPEARPAPGRQTLRCLGQSDCC